MLRSPEMSIRHLLAAQGQLPPSLVVQAHPDDEVIGAGGHLAQFHAARFVHVTDGAPRDRADAEANGFAGVDEYRVARREELEAAMAMAGILPDQLEEIACPDQQASFHMVDIALKLAELIRRHRPEVLFTHPYEGGHPDHDATAFAAHAACRLLLCAGEGAPLLYEISSYHNGPNGITPGCFLSPNSGDPGEEEMTLILDATQRATKRAMFAAFRTQQGTLQYFPIEKECIRKAPRYCFTQPPHAGRLFYEMYSWGMTGARFNALAGEAQARLGLEVL